MDDKLTQISHIPDEVMKWGNCLLLHEKTPIMIGNEIKHICKICNKFYDK